MKLLMNLAGIMLLSVMCLSNLAAQEVPMYMTLTISHWNWDCEECNPDRWMELEKAWHDNVTMKNEHILASGVYNHYYTADNSEVGFVSLYPSWAAIEAAQQRAQELAKEAWPDEEERKKMMAERSSYYHGRHEDEIMITWPHAKGMESTPEEPMVFLVVDRHLSFTNEGSDEEHMALLKEFHENVTHKNSHIQGFWPHRHAWGSDGRHVMNVFALKSLADVKPMQEENQKLIEAYWPDEEKRKAFMSSMGKYYTPFHSDRFYMNVPELAKDWAPPAAEEESAE